MEIVTKDKKRGWPIQAYEVVVNGSSHNFSDPWVKQVGSFNTYNSQV